MTRLQLNARTRALALFAALTGLATGANALTATAQSESPRWDQSPAVDQRVDSILAEMTTEEKVDLATGELNNLYGFYNNGNERLGIPPLTMADGPAGVRIANPDVNDQRATALPAPIALASTWDKSLAGAYGQVLGSEARASGHNVQLGPSVDVARAPRAGRTFENFGEDPLLASRLVAPEIGAIQSQPVLATLKHHNLYTQETERFNYDAQVDERSLREIYLPAFQAAVQQGGAGAAMCAFNKIGGAYACENGSLLNDVLKGDLGFRGFVMSDYGATKSTAPAANGGLDQEQPGTSWFGPKLLDAISAGEVSTERLDDMARRILRPMVGLGLLDSPPQVGDLPTEESAAVAREVAAKGTVLLKNQGDALPLASDELGSLAVIGPDADNTSAAGGGSALVKPAHEVSPLDGIRARAGSGVQVEYAEGADPVAGAALLPGPAPVPSSVLTPPNGEGNGLQAEYWNNTGFEGEPTISRTERNADLKLGFVNFPGFNASSPKAGQFPAAMNGDISARWTGRITAPKSGSYQLGLTSRGNGRLLLDGEPLVEQTTDSITSKSATVELAAGEPHEVEIEYSAPRIGRYVGAEIRFTWEHADDIVTPAMQRAADLAGRSDAAVVVVRNYETEGDDRPSLDLPNEQAQLIRAVAAANPRTIVVLMSGGPVETASWDSAPHAVLEAWYAGQEQGAAIADVLFGDVNPSGKLPLTFPRSEAETPLRTAEQFPGVEGKVHYTDGVFVGYRGYEELGLDPQYPFGHGLSYTKFRYRKLRVKEPRGRKPPRVRFTIRNRGELSGTEVAQVYVGRLPTSVPTPQKALAGFAKAKVRPRRERRVTVKLDPRALSYWDAESDAWVAPKGKVRVFVGSSSRDIRLARKLKLR